MIVAIVTFNLSKPETLEAITKVFQGTAPKYQGVTGLLRKNALSWRAAARCASLTQGPFKSAMG